MHDGMQYDPHPRSRSRSRALENFEIFLFSKAITSAIYNGSWELTAVS